MKTLYYQGFFFLRKKKNLNISWCNKRNNFQNSHGPYINFFPRIRRKEKLFDAIKDTSPKL